MPNKKEMEFTWEYCSTCRGYMIICPKCGNNCCNSSNGKLIDGRPAKISEWDDPRAIKCDVCALAYQFQALGWKYNDEPQPTPEQLAEPSDISRILSHTE